MCHYHSGFSTALRLDASASACRRYKSFLTSLPARRVTLTHFTLARTNPSRRLPRSQDFRQHTIGPRAATPSTDRASIAHVPADKTRTHPPLYIHPAELVLPPPIEISGFLAPILVDSIRSSRVAPATFFEHTHAHILSFARRPNSSRVVVCQNRETPRRILLFPPQPSSIRDPSIRRRQTTPVSSHPTHPSHQLGTLLIHPAETVSRAGVTRGQDRQSPAHPPSSAALSGRGLDPPSPITPQWLATKPPPSPLAVRSIRDTEPHARAPPPQLGLH